jgi:hypothetical protein
MVDELEKRKFQRLEFPLEVIVEIVSAHDVPKGLPQLHIKSRNISKDGICLETKSIEVDGVNLLSGLPFARENRLHLIIDLIPEEPPFAAIGEVRWYDIAHDIPDFIYRLGVAFIEINDGEKDQLARFLEKYQNNKGYFQRLLHKG